jgi:acyl-coenzyme A thioesterase PaaI-like protein
MNIKDIVKKAEHSAFYLWLLNWGLGRMIPFNKPHGFTVVQIRDGYIKIKIPYQRSNFNHIKGLHACGLATISEYSTGLVLVNSLDAKKYRIIMQKFEMNYHFQGKMDAFAEFSASEQWINEQIVRPLETQEAVVVPCEVKIHDKQGNHLSTGQIYWQVKPWAKVRTKV